jgi:uncharacterized membrane protein SpoIIM required for sporulation
MLESIINPKKIERGPVKMLFIGLVYASLSILLAHFFFKSDPVLSRYSGILVVTFCVMFSLPFIYYLTKQEEKEDEEVEGLLGVWRVHRDALLALMFLFLGFVIAFSFWHVILGSDVLFNAQIETYCRINSPGNIEQCVSRYSFEEGKLKITGGFASAGRFFGIFENNIYVMIFTLAFSLLFGAGAIFILAWNASVIAAAIGIISQYRLIDIPLAFCRYLPHGIPEIAAYFVTALAGGMFGFGILRHGFEDKTFLRVVENVIILLFVSVVLLILAAIIEVYFTSSIYGVCSYFWPF